jgi:hypothetical protein
MQWTEGTKAEYKVHLVQFFGWLSTSQYSHMILNNNQLTEAFEIDAFLAFLSQRKKIDKDTGESVNLALSSLSGGSFIIEYKGNLSRKKIEGPYVVEVCKGSVWVDGAVGGNLSRLINHSCDPNCVLHVEPFNKKAMIFAARTIVVGEELTLSYSKDELPFDCACQKCVESLQGK